VIFSDSIDRERIVFHDSPRFINRGDVGHEKAANPWNLRAGSDELRLLIAIIQKLSMLDHQRVDYF
jgi:hypothetical protein